MTIDSIWIQPGYSGREAIKGAEGARRLGMDVYWGKRPADVSRCAPIGDVPFCEALLPEKPVPDFYPEFLRPWRRRHIGFSCGVIPYGEWFVKSTAGYKDVTPRIVRYSDWGLVEFGKLAYSEVVTFAQEWRYYVADGCVLETGWYDGNDDMEPAPDLGIEWPEGWHGAADFGRLDTGELALVECQAGYACGWYGEDHAAYVMWLTECWKNLTMCAVE